MAPVPNDISKAPLASDVESSQPVPDAIPSDVLLNEEPQDLEAQLEERRRKRKELLERLTGIQSGVNSDAPSSVGGMASTNSAGKVDSLAGLSSTAAHLELSSNSASVVQSTEIEAATPLLTVAEESNRFDLANTDLAGSKDIIPAETQASALDGEPQVSAADYDPNDDRKADDVRQQNLAADAVTGEEVASGVGEPGPADLAHDGEKPLLIDGEEWEEVEVEDDGEEFDMFALDDEPKKKKKILRKKQGANDVLLPKVIQKTAVPVVDVSTLLDNYDDSEGYYRITPGEVLDGGRYQVTVTLGKGMFSAVYRATIVKAIDPEDELGREVAIKVIRSQESM